MSLASESRKHAQDWFQIAESLPATERQRAFDVAEAWFRLAMDAEAMETRAPVRLAVH